MKINEFSGSELNDIKAETDIIAKGLEVGEAESFLDKMLDMSELRLEYHKPMISAVSFGSVCTS